MSLLDAYQANYDRIAADHVRHWRKTGHNPFQTPDALKENENATFGLLTRHVAPGASVLDAGCGMGDLMRRLIEYRPFGVDISQEYLDIAYKRGLTVQKHRIEALPFPNAHFDAVIAADILEHVLDLHGAVKELLRVLKPGGVIVTRVPDREPVSCGPLSGYDFVHLRILDEGTMCVLFSRIFGCEILEQYVLGNSIHTAARK